MRRVNPPQPLDGSLDGRGVDLRGTSGVTDESAHLCPAAPGGLEWGDRTAPQRASWGYSSVWESAWIAPRRSPVRARLAPLQIACNLAGLPIMAPGIGGIAAALVKGWSSGDIAASLAGSGACSWSTLVAEAPAGSCRSSRRANGLSPMLRPDLLGVAGLRRRCGCRCRVWSSRRVWPRMRLTWATSRREVDDQVAGEGVAQVVEAKRRPAIVVEARVVGGTVQRPALALR